MTASLLYAGAAVAGALMRQRVEREEGVVPGDFPRLLAMAVAGAVIGPVALAWGLQRTSGTSASLMLTLEALFTAVLGWRLYREAMDRRVWAAMLLLLSGGILLGYDQGRDGGARVWGLLAVLVATAAWGLDNTLSRKLAERDPGQVVLAKAGLGAIATALLAVSFGGVTSGARCGARSVRSGRRRLRSEPAFLPAGTADLRGRTHGFGLRFRAIHRSGACRVYGRPFHQLADGGGQLADARRCGFAPGRVTRTRA